MYIHPPYEAAATRNWARRTLTGSLPLPAYLPVPMLSEIFQCICMTILVFSHEMHKHRHEGLTANRADLLTPFFPLKVKYIMLEIIKFLLSVPKM